MPPIPVIPGTGVLGSGFNIFGEYSRKSTTLQMFSMKIQEDRQWEFPATKRTYLLPDNVKIPEGIDKGVGDSHVLDSRSKVEEHFGGKANIHGSYGAFSGQFEASFGHTSQSDTAYTFSIYESEYHAWRLSLKSFKEDMLADWVTSDPTFSELPSQFDERSKNLFYRFFDQYGTHFVFKVTTGHRLYYSSAVEKSYTRDKTEIKAKLELEYNATFIKAGIEAEAEWNKVGEQWTQHREAHIETVGGDSSLLAAAAPGFGANFSGQYTRWKESAEDSPVTVDFELKPMSALFSGDKAEAMEEAFEAYARDRVYVESKFEGSTIMVRGKVERPDEPPIERGSGFQVTVLDRQTLEPVANRYVMFAWGEEYWGRWEPLYNDELLPLLRTYDDDQYLVILATRGMRQGWVPPENVYQMLLSMGASPTLHGWTEYIYQGGGSPSLWGVNYILVGVPGRGVGSGFEAISRGERAVQIYEQPDGRWGVSNPEALPLMARLTVSLRRFQMADSRHEPVLLSVSGSLAEAA